MMEVVKFEENTDEAFEMDLLAGPVWVLSIVFFLLTAPIHFARDVYFAIQ